MSKRRLKPDELDLWRQVAERTERLELGGRHVEQKPMKSGAPAVPRKRKPEPATHGSPFPPKPAARKTSQDLIPAITDRLAKAPLQMDRKAYARMSRGKLIPEGRLDLHGMTLDRAHPRLSRFILSSHSQGKRLVLVITGKGKDRDEGGPIPVRFGILRHQVPQWLSQPPLKGVVLQITPAHISHGGGGAYYVYLRRSR